VTGFDRLQVYFSMITEKCYVDVLMTTCRRIFSIRQLFFKMLTNPKQSIWTSLEYPGFWWKKRLDAARDIAFWKVVDSTRFHQIPPLSTRIRHFRQLFVDEQALSKGM